MKQILAAQGITKRFPGVVALRNIDFDLYPGEVHCLCGENGAGKSTLIKILAGVYPHGSYDGRLSIRGEPVRFRTVADSQASGIAVIYQEVALIDELTVAENIFLGAEHVRAGLIDWHRLNREARNVLKRFNVDIDVMETVRNLGIGQKQLIEIAKALAKNSSILILDEPTAALAEHEVFALLDILRGLRSRGISCLYISHKLDEVMSIADRVTILRDGESVCTSGAPEIGKAEIIRRMVGREIGELFPPKPNVEAQETVVLEVRELCVDAPNRSLALSNISFSLHAGEILGIGGLMGAGRTELLLHIFGIWGRRKSGAIFLFGKEIGGDTPTAIIRRGLVLMSEDRRRHGLVLEQDLSFNLSLSSLGSICHGVAIDAGMERQRNLEVANSLKVKMRGLETIAGSLSGGNQQKVVLGKALLTDPKVILLDEPTRGIDTGAKQEIYEIVRRLAASGKAVLLVSSELVELMGLSDRILMIHEGAMAGMFSSAQASQQQLLSAAMGQARVELLET